MKRIWKIYRLLAAQNLKRIMEYRADFLTGAVSFLIDQAVGIAFIFIIFTQIPQLAGFTFEQILFIYGFSQIPKGLDHLLADNLWCVGYFIVRKGDFDKYLIRPVNPLFHVIAETFQVDAIGELVVGIALLIYASPGAGLRFPGIKSAEKTGNRAGSAALRRRKADENKYIVRRQNQGKILE